MTFKLESVKFIQLKFNFIQVRPSSAPAYCIKSFSSFSLVKMLNNKYVISGKTSSDILNMLLDKNLIVLDNLFLFIQEYKNKNNIKYLYEYDQKYYDNYADNLALYDIIPRKRAHRHEISEANASYLNLRGSRYGVHPRTPQQTPDNNNNKSHDIC